MQFYPKAIFGIILNHKKCIIVFAAHLSPSSRPPVISVVAGRGGPVAGAGSGRAGDWSGNQAPSQWSPASHRQASTATASVFKWSPTSGKWGQNQPLYMHSGCHSSVHREQTSFQCANVVIARIFVKKCQAAASDAKHSQIYFNMEQIIDVSAKIIISLQFVTDKLVSLKYL